MCSEQSTLSAIKILRKCDNNVFSKRNKIIFSKQKPKQRCQLKPYYEKPKHVAKMPKYLAK